jgi:hypothetical protein
MEGVAGVRCTVSERHFGVDRNPARYSASHGVQPQQHRPMRVGAGPVCRAWVSVNPMSRSALLRRLVSPAGLVLVLLALLLPFVSGACTPQTQTGVRQEQREGWRVTYDGTDMLVGGRPDVDFADESSNGRLRRLSDNDVRDLLGDARTKLDPQPLAWLAVALVVAGVVAGVVRSTRWRAVVTAALALAAGLSMVAATLLAREQAIDMAAAILQGIGAPRGQTPPSVRNWEHYDQVRDMFRLRHGFWLATGVLLVVGMTNVALAVPGRTSAQGVTHEDDTPPEAPQPEFHRS